VLVVLAAALAVKLAGPVLDVVAAACAIPPLHGAVYPLHGVARAAQPLPQPAIERPGELHLHGVTAEDVAAILNLQADEETEAGRHGHHRR
jgi:hypothetical protein